MNRRYRTPTTVRFCHWNSPFHVQVVAISVCLATEILADPLPTVSNSPKDLELRPVRPMVHWILAIGRVCPVFPKCWPRLAFSELATRPCGRCDSSRRAPPLLRPPKYP